MSERTWAHDPDAGCSGCPLFDGSHCGGEPDDHGDSGRFLGSDERHAARAPGWCPLRGGSVRVVNVSKVWPTGRATTEPWK